MTRYSSHSNSQTQQEASSRIPTPYTHSRPQRQPQRPQADHRQTTGDHKDTTGDHGGPSQTYAGGRKVEANRRNIAIIQLNPRIIERTITRVNAISHPSPRLPRCTHQLSP
ncbi:hypothetical protein E2C01_056072 [Portunus trituberculatus]|uniref:Uncharacterized protein n=1 Tax=Portunus trituberculatus TaxID=210409 RepID=A0A5B7GT39_PORTR|nr:hypothetical protein [Portunus trituberculatus]